MENPNTQSPVFADSYEANRNKAYKVTLISRIAVVLSIIFGVSLIFASGIIPIPFGIGFSKAPVVLENGDIPCLPEENMKFVDLKKIKVSVLNSTNKVGLAGATAKALKNAGVNVLLVGNTERKIDSEVNIKTNAKDVVKAYTLARLFQSAKITYSSNLKNIEVILGESFSNILDESQVKRTLQTPLVSSKRCITGQV